MPRRRRRIAMTATAVALGSCARLVTCTSDIGIPTFSTCASFIARPWGRCCGRLLYHSGRRASGSRSCRAGCAAGCAAGATDALAGRTPTQRRRSRPTQGESATYPSRHVSVDGHSMLGVASSSAEGDSVDMERAPARHASGGRVVVADPGGRTETVLPPLTHEQLPDESIYILDGTSMLVRAFYGRGAGGYLAADGATEVGAVLAMGIEFAQFIMEVKPRYLAMAFDVGRETTFRREMYSPYKAQRKPHPIDLTLQMPLARALAEALGCRTFALEGFEADDVMATLSRWARSAGLGVVLCSADKDMCQLIRDRVHVMQPRSNGYAILGDEEVKAKFGVKPSSLPDLFGLVGDAADNIPGVRGIGKKGGLRLLERFGDLEGIFAGVNSVGDMSFRGSQGLQQLLGKIEVQEEAMLFREIATLHDEVPLDGVEDLNSSLFLYRGVSPEAASVMKVLGFTAPLMMIQEGRTTPPPLAGWNQFVI